MTNDQIERLIHAFMELGFGDRKDGGPGAIEGLTCAVAGPGDPRKHGNNVAESLQSIASAIERLADAVLTLADKE